MATNVELGWEYEGDRHQWTAFSEEHNDAINETHNDTSKRSVKLMVHKVQLEIKLDKMVQRNCKTGWERRIRCAVKDDSGDCENLPYLFLTLIFLSFIHHKLWGFETWKVSIIIIP